MTNIKNVQALIALWPSVAEFADDLSDAMGHPIDKQLAYRWVRVNRIQKKYHAAIMKAALMRADAMEYDLRAIEAAQHKLRTLASLADLEFLSKKRDEND